METFELHPTGRSEDASQAKARQNAIIRKELQQSSKAVTKSQRVKLGRRGLTRRTASHGILLNVCGFCSVSFSGFSQKWKICGGLAQLVERLPCKQEVSGSTPLISTTFGSLAQSVRALA